MTTRTRYTGSSTDVPWDDAGATEGFGNQYNRLMGVLYDHSALVLTSIGGTGDAVTASLDPALDSGGLVDGMKFTLTWGAVNTGAVTLAINGGSALPVLDAEGAALTAGRLASGLRSLLEYVGGSFRVLTSLAGGLTVPTYYEAFTASGTWAKPADLAPDALVVVEAWGAGGSGARNNFGTAGGGGGGAYARKMFRAADLPSSVAVAIGAGGAARTTSGNGNAGGDTTFGALLTAYGGGAGNTLTDLWGAGAGEHNSSGKIGGGTGDAKTIYGGGGGAYTYTIPGEPPSTGYSLAGYAVYGGGGGGLGSSVSGDRAAGLSVHGGNGGNGGWSTGPVLAEAGSAPGGGGGGASNVSSGAGARGEVRVWVP